MAQVDINQLVLKSVRAICNVAGASLIAFNITAFTVEKHGSYYFRDPNQVWLAVGIAFIVIAYTIKNWDKP